ncbi:hypothetical protein LJR118_003525 [Acidovorax sp. LjRoot118]|uniref:hypothetical protein n=1 Tax=Acidovorax sp. LjRoot118 TaxID=3342256 RepID=UPI003ECDC1D9
MRPGWNPVRRNRNIGTPAQGHGEDNRLTIPESRHDRSFFHECLGAWAAHRCAADRFAAMQQAGAVPFAPQPDPAMRQAHGLNDPWFAAP